MDTSVDITRALIVSIRGLPKDWSRPPGRPRHTWAHENKSESSRFLSFFSFCAIRTNFNMLFLMVLSSFNESVYILQN